MDDLHNPYHPSPAADLWAHVMTSVQAAITRAIDEHLQSHHPPGPVPPPSFQTYRPEQSDLVEDDPKAREIASRVLAGRSGPTEAMHIPIATGAIHIPIAVHVHDQEIAAMIATQLKTYQPRLDNVAAQTGPLGYRDLDPDTLRAFRDRLARNGTRETCPLCDVDYWIAQWQLHPRPLIAKVCLCCGFIAYFDAVLVGVLPPEPERPPYPRIPADLVNQVAERVVTVLRADQANQAATQSERRQGPPSQ